MGVSIHGDHIRVGEVIRQIDAYVKKNGGYREGALPADEFFDKVATDFGAVLDQHFVLVYNEYYEDYNPSYNFDRAVSLYYFPYVDLDEDYDKHFDLENTTYFGGGANAEEVVSAVFEEEFGDEGKFSDRWDD